MNQFFTPKKIDSYVTSLSQCVDMLVVNLQENHLNRDFDLLPHLEKCALRGVCSTLFGMNLTDPKIDEICERTSEIFDL